MPPTVPVLTFGTFLWQWVGEYFRKGCPTLYDDYGDEQHKLNLKHVLKFLDMCNETSPVDLTVLIIIG